VDVAEDAIELAGFELEDDDREAAAARLAELPPVDERDYYSTATRLEVLDIVVDAARVRRMAEDEPEVNLTPEDYARD
jgi:hypothetical protein